MHFERQKLSDIVSGAGGISKLHSAREAARAAGRLPAPVRIGGRVLWRIDAIRAWLAAGAPDRETWAARCAARR